VSHDPEQGCVAPDEGDDDVAEDTVRFTDRVQLALSTPDEDLVSAFGQTTGHGWTRSGLLDPLVLWARNERPDVKLSDADLSVLDRLPEAERERMRTLWSDAGLLGEDGEVASGDTQVARVQAETVVITAAPTAQTVTAVAPVRIATATAVSPSGVSTRSSTGSRILPSTTRPAAAAAQGGGTSGVQIFNSTTPAPAAIATVAGLPEPSIIVGEIRATNASFNPPTETGGSVTGTSLETGSIEARQSLLSTSPDLYLELIANGAFDPADVSEEGIATAIQIELQRMNCYTSTIDGDFGPGSRAALALYYQQIGTPAPTTDPTIELYRAIIAGEEVTCPVVRRAATPRNTATGQTTRSTAPAQPRRQAAPAARPRATAPAAKPKPQSGGINPNTLGTGVFR